MSSTRNNDCYYKAEWEEKSIPSSRVRCTESVPGGTQVPSKGLSGEKSMEPFVLILPTPNAEGHKNQSTSASPVLLSSTRPCVVAFAIAGRMDTGVRFAGFKSEL